MTQNRKLTEHRNIGRKIAERLSKAGIFSKEDLGQVGAADLSKVRQVHPEETLLVCHCLYSFEGLQAINTGTRLANKEKSNLNPKLTTRPLSTRVNPLGKNLRQSIFQTVNADAKRITQFYSME